MGGKGTAIFLFGFQIIIIILYALFTEYGHDAVPNPANKGPNNSAQIYPMFQDVHVMIFVGFGFLMTFLRRYGFSSVGFNFLLAATILEWGILCEGIFDHGVIKVGLLNLLKSDIVAAAVLISMGAVLGKTTPLQLLIMGIIEAIVYVCNEELLLEVLKAVDIGGSMVVHVFGAYFGLAVSKVMGRPSNRALEGSSYTSDLFAMIGNLFLWLFWPSFVGSLATGDAQQRAIINTYIAIAASCVTAYAFSSISSKENKFNMVHIQNATLAGGVAIGSTADLMLQPYLAAIIGAVAGVLSTIGYVHIQPGLEKKLGLHDSCGVHNLHGMPGVLGGIVSAIVAAAADEITYGPSLYVLFPARAAVNSTNAAEETVLVEGRSSLEQAGYQLLGLTLTLLIALVAGAITGVMLKVISPWTGKVGEDELFDDSAHWELEEEETEAEAETGAISIVGNKTDPESNTSQSFHMM